MDPVIEQRLNNVQHQIIANNNSTSARLNNLEYIKVDKAEFTNRTDCIASKLYEHEGMLHEIYDKCNVNYSFDKIIEDAQKKSTKIITGVLQCLAEALFANSEVTEDGKIKLPLDDFINKLNKIKEEISS